MRMSNVYLHPLTQKVISHTASGYHLPSERNDVIMCQQKEPAMGGAGRGRGKGRRGASDAQVMVLVGNSEVKGLHGVPRNGVAAHGQDDLTHWRRVADVVTVQAPLWW